MEMSRISVSGLVNDSYAKPTYAKTKKDIESSNLTEFLGQGER